MIKYPTRCEIIDVTAQEVFPGVAGRTPSKSKPHIGKQGIAERIVIELGTGQLKTVKITLDDGNILYGYECWWKPIDE